MTVSTSTSTSTSTGVQVLKTLQYWVIPGVYGTRMDYMMRDETFASFVAPDPNSYVASVVNNDNHTLNDHKDDDHSHSHDTIDDPTKRRWMWVAFWSFVAVAFIVIVGWVLYSYWQNRQAQHHHHHEKQTIENNRHLEGETSRDHTEW